MRGLVCLLALAGIARFSAAATFSDGFEDGDYTSNPTWTVQNAVGAADVASDPLRAGDQALRGYGTETAHHELKSVLPATVPWVGFDFSAEILATTDDFHPRFILRRPSDYEITIGAQRDGTTHVNFTVTDSPGSSHLVQPEIGSPTSEWWRVRAWHDVGANLIWAQIRRVSDDGLLASQSFSPGKDLSAAGDIDRIILGIEETDWQYIDNVSLGTIPEPGSTLLLAMGGLAILWRRRG